MKRKKKKFKSAPVLAAVLLAAVLLTTLFSRTDSPVNPYREASRKQREYFYLAPVTPLFRREKDDGRWTYAARRSMNPPYPRFSAVKDKGVKRIFLIGGSVVQLFDEDTLRAALERELPGERFEIVDCGLSAYDSGRDRLILEEILGYEPDLVIIMSGVNEGERIGSVDVRRFPWLARSVLHGLLHLSPLRAYRLARPALEPTPPPERVAAEFEANIRAMARMAKARRTPVLFAALPWNLRDMPPRGELPLGDKTFFDAWLAYEEGDFAVAAALLREALPGFSGDPAGRKARAFASYYLARALDRRGDFAAARAQYLDTLEHGIPPMPALNRGLRRLSREEHVPLADIEEAFARVGPHGLTGADLFEDDMHWDRFLDPLVSAAIVKALAGTWPVGGAELEIERFRELSRRADTRREKAWIVFRFRAWGNSLARQGRLSERVVALMDVVYLSHPDLLASAAELKSWLKKKLAGNIWDSAAAENLDTWWPVMLGHIGEVYLRRGMSLRALPFFDEALRLSPGLTAVRLRRAVALARAGRKEEAARAFDALADRREELPEIGYYRESLARLKVMKGKAPPSAVKAKDLAREGSRFMGSAQKTFAEAVAAHKNGDAPEALERLAELEMMEPDAAQRLEMARLYMRLGQNDAAVKTLSRAEIRRLTREHAVRAGAVYGDLKEDALALSAWTRASELDPRDPEAWFKRAYHAERAGRRDEMPEALRRAGGLTKRPERRMHAAEKLAELGHRESALSFADQVRAEASGTELLMRVGWLYQRFQEYPRAIEVFGKLAKSEKSAAAAALRDKGVCEYLSGKPEQALKDFREAIARDPDLLSAYLSAGTVYESQGRNEEALVLYERGLRAKPSEAEKPLREKLVEVRDRVRAIR